ncbi:hypothetical protein [Chroococcidiopsis cubana]|uniref:hypothetical protein n=1 Tax=Chroococcidiopsis cubana TaxID=171392 RepID=UPI002ACDA8E1|nr:hypothetical protein [Chroococcidiopsis cubana]
MRTRGLGRQGDKGTRGTRSSLPSVVGIRGEGDKGTRGQGRYEDLFLAFFSAPSRLCVT